jgi:uncharacterized protein YjbI with pentapeptide repeats
VRCAGAYLRELNFSAASFFEADLSHATLVKTQLHPSCVLEREQEAVAVAPEVYLALAEGTPLLWATAAADACLFTAGLFAGL